MKKLKIYKKFKNKNIEKKKIYLQWRIFYITDKYKQATK